MNWLRTVRLGRSRHLTHASLATLPKSTIGRPGHRFFNTPLKRRLVYYGLTFSGVCAASVSAILIAWAIPLGDFGPVLPVPEPNGIVTAIAPDPQREKHTCGFHALRAIYRSYGLDPEKRRLRQRLGVDQSAYLYDPTTTGCIHPDIYRVLNQDGFEFTTPDLDRTETLKAVTEHLATGHYALALIKRRSNGHLHWVVLHGIADGRFMVCDSLAAAPYPEIVQDFWEQCLLGVTLVGPRREPVHAPVWRLHLAGAKDMYQAASRRLPADPAKNERAQSLRD